MEITARVPKFDVGEGVDGGAGVAK